jgi:hypothetical protein
MDNGNTYIVATEAYYILKLLYKLILELAFKKCKNSFILDLIKRQVSRNPTTRASIGEPRTLVYTLCIAYVSYARVYHLLMPLTLMIDHITSCRLRKYIHLVATVPCLVILYYIFFYH